MKRDGIKPEIKISLAPTEGSNYGTELSNRISKRQCFLSLCHLRSRRKAATSGGYKAATPLPLAWASYDSWMAVGLLGERDGLQRFFAERFGILCLSLGWASSSFWGINKYLLINWGSVKQPRVESQKAASQTKPLDRSQP